MKRSVNFRRRPRRATANDIVFTLQRLGMSDEEMRKAFSKNEKIVQPAIVSVEPVDEAERQAAECATYDFLNDDPRTPE